ncbi:MULTISPECIES: MFS transporter [unclassified Variovorax]|uniref:MFS transporter n=1 Tax=unclassified Variovorax TaxID=663243 RepID=UPI0032E72AFE
MRIKRLGIAIAAISICQFILWGTIYSSFTLFIDPIHRELGWGKTFIVTSFSIALGVSGLCAIPIGKWVDRWGGFFPLSVGAALSSVLLLALSVNENPMIFAVAWIGLGVAMAAVLSQTAYAVFVQMGMEIGRKAILYCSLGTAASGAVFLPLCSYLIAEFGWRDSLRVLAALNLLCAALHLAYVPRRHPDFIAADSSSRPPRSPLLARNRQLLLMLAAFGTNSAISAVLAVQLVPLLLWGNYSMHESVLTAALVGPAQILIRVLMVGRLSQKISYYGLGVCAMGFQAISLIALSVCIAFSPGTTLLYIFSILNGLSLGAGLISRALITTEFFEAQAYGAAQGYIQSATMLARAVAPAFFAFIMNSLEVGLSLYFLLTLGAISFLSMAMLKGKIFPALTPASVDTN